MHRDINKKDFSNLIGITKNKLYRKILANDPEKIFEIPVSIFMKIIDLFNQYSEKKTDFEEFFSIKLNEKYPPSEVFAMKREETDLINMLKESRKTSLREVERMSKRLFKDPDYHLTETYLMRIERGDYKNPSVNKLKALSKIYRIPIQMLL